MIFLNRMNNSEAKVLLKECRAELQDIKRILSTDTSIKFNRITKYLTNYAIIKACSTIEYCCKKEISDFFQQEQSLYVKNFISNKIRKESSNPSLTLINSTLKSFHDSYNDKFNKAIKIKRNVYDDSLEKLREARNKVAHGENITVNVDFVITHYQNCREIITHLDNVLKKENQEFSPSLLTM